MSLPGPANVQHLAYVVAKEKNSMKILVSLGECQHRRAARQCDERSGVDVGERALFVSLRSLHAGDVSRRTCCVLLEISNESRCFIVRPRSIDLIIERHEASGTFGGSTDSVLQAVRELCFGQKFAEYRNIPEYQGKAIALIRAAPRLP